MTAEEKKEWEKWQKRESKAQGMLKASVSLAIKLDLDDLKSAGDMWAHCEHLHALNIVENQREVRRKLYSLDLQDDATSEEMAAHVELFSRLIMEAKLVGIGHTSHERAAMFVGTILGPAFRPVIAEINAVAEKPSATGRWYSQSTTPSRLAARLALLLDRPHHGVVPSWPQWASQGSAERPRSKGGRIVDPTCRRSNVTSATRQGTMRGIAGRRPKAAATSLEVVKSARTTTVGNEEPSEDTEHTHQQMTTRRRRDASPSPRLCSTSTSHGLA